MESSNEFNCVDSGDRSGGENKSTFGLLCPSDTQAVPGPSHVMPNLSFGDDLYIAGGNEDGMKLGKFEDNFQQYVPVRKYQLKENVGETAPVLSEGALPNFLLPPERLPMAADLGFSASVLESSSFSYSKRLNCIFASLQSLFTIQFVWNADLCVAERTRFWVRATPVYTDPNHAHVPVRRCTQHTDGISPGGACVLQSAQGGDADFLSVLFPVDPRAGQDSHVFRFACLKGCATGMNRRKIALDFTLESCSGSHGRVRILARPCARPKRDMDTEERKLPAPPARRRPSPRGSLRSRLQRRRRGSCRLYLLQFPIPNIRAMRVCMKKFLHLLKCMLRDADKPEVLKYRWCIRNLRRQMLDF